MTHAREKLTLGAIRRLCCMPSFFGDIFGLAQCLFSLFAFGDIAYDSFGAYRSFIFIEHYMRRDRYIDRVSIFSFHRYFVVIQNSLGRDGKIQFLIILFIHKKALNMLSDNFLWAIATMLLNRWADCDQVTMIIGRVEYILDVFKDISIFFFTEAQSLFGLFPFSNVAINTQQEFVVAK